MQCAVLWMELVTGRRVDASRAVCAEWLMALPGLERFPTHDEALALGELMRRRGRWRGVRRTEEGVRLAGGVEPVERIGEALLAVGDVCVRDTHVLLFADPRHKELYVLLARCGLDEAVFGPLCSALEVQRSEVRSLHYHGQAARDRLWSEAFWAQAAQALWPEVEPISLQRWMAERTGAESRLSTEHLLEQVVAGETRLGTSQVVAVLVARHPGGRHARCLVVLVRPSAWRWAAGSVLLFSYASAAGCI